MDGKESPRPPSDTPHPPNDTIVLSSPLSLLIHDNLRLSEISPPHSTLIVVVAMHSTRSVYMHYFMLLQRDDPTTDRPTVTLLCPSIGGLCTCSLLHSSLTQAFIESIAYLYKYIAIKSTYHSTCTQCHIISSVAGNSTVEPPPPPPLWIYRPNLTDRLTAIHDRWWWGFSRQFVYQFRFEP